MPQRDVYHEAVKQALIKDGWTITHDPYTLVFGSRRVYVDLGLTPPLAASKNGRRLLVEIKSLLSPSPLTDLERTLGQYILYRSWLIRTAPDYDLVVAVSADTARTVFDDPAVQVVLEDNDIRLVVVNIDQMEIVRWIR